MKMRVLLHRPCLFLLSMWMGCSYAPGQTKVDQALARETRNASHRAVAVDFRPASYMVFDRTSLLSGSVGVASLPRELNLARRETLLPKFHLSPSSSGADLGATDAEGSTNVPMDSWVYPALERLSSLGLIPSQSVAIRPWTRKECARQIAEAEGILLKDGDLKSLEDEAERILVDLRKEFAATDGAGGVVVESAYTRFGTIAGPALADSFNLGQTWWNDYGRPLGRGGSAIAGYSFHATHGRFFFYNRQELQQSPTAAPLAVPATLPQSFGPAYLRQRPLELYAGVAFAGNALSFGKQALYWGPTTMGPLAFSNNAEPTYNLRLVATRPHRFPFFPSLGTYRFDLVFGKLSGHHYPARPYYNGQKADFTFGKNLEISFTRWSILWGVGHPMTLGSLKDNFFSSTSPLSQTNFGNRLDPGDRKSGFDFRLHVPGLEKYVTVYADSYADDELNPLAAPRRVVWSPGIYLARLPYVNHMDFRFEMVSSEELSEDEGPIRFFFNNQYYDGNTNKGFLLGNAVGRDGRAFEGRTGYWVSPRSKLEVGFRQNKGSIRFLQGGTTISDAFVNGSFALNSEWSVNLFAQHERLVIPAYLKGVQHNESGWLQVTWNPKLRLIH